MTVSPSGTHSAFPSLDTLGWSSVDLPSGHLHALRGFLDAQKDGSVVFQGIPPKMENQKETNQQGAASKNQRARPNGAQMKAQDTSMGQPKDYLQPLL